MQHAELTLGNGMVMLGQYSEKGWMGGHAPDALAGTISLYLVVDDPDAHHDRAKAAGAKIVREPADQGYGSREYSARDMINRLRGIHAEAQFFLRNRDHDVLARGSSLPSALSCPLRRVQGVARLRRRVIVGDLPKRALRLVQDWAELHADDLLADWQLAVSGEPLDPIDPLL